MAGHASRARQIVVFVDVAIGALPRRNGVQSGQRESRAVVIECRVHPVGGVVTLIAGLREVRRHVVRIGRSLIVLEMAVYARRAAQVVIIVHVAIGARAWRYRVHACERESSGSMVEGRTRPVTSAMALIAGLREIRGDVVRIRRALVVLQMASYAGCAGQVVVIVNVAIGAGARRHRVQAGQSKARGGVIELGVGPRHRVVALLARSGESTMRHRRGRVVVIRLMTADAGRICNVVVVVDVAIRTSAWRNHVRTSQRES